MTASRSKVPVGLPRSARVAARLALDEVRLSEARLEVHPVSAVIEVDVDVQVRSGWERRADGLDVIVGVWLRLLPTESPAEPPSDGAKAVDPVLSVVVEHLIRYEVPAGFDADDDEYAAFVDQSAVLTAWPFARETIQSLAAKAGFPQVTLPMRRSELPAFPSSDTTKPKPAKPRTASKNAAAKKAPAKRAVAKKAE